MHLGMTLVDSVHHFAVLFVNLMKFLFFHKGNHSTAMAVGSIIQHDINFLPMEELNIIF